MEQLLWDRTESLCYFGMKTSEHVGAKGNFTDKKKR